MLSLILGWIEMAAVWRAADSLSSPPSSLPASTLHIQRVPLRGVVSWTAQQSNCLFLVWPALNLPFPVLGFELMYNTKQQQLLSFHSPHRKISCSQHVPFWQVIVEFVNRCCVSGNLPAYSHLRNIMFSRRYLCNYLKYCGWHLFGLFRGYYANLPSCYGLAKSSYKFIIFRTLSTLELQKYAQDKEAFQAKMKNDIQERSFHVICLFSWNYIRSLCYDWPQIWHLTLKITVL